MNHALSWWLILVVTAVVVHCVFLGITPQAISRPYHSTFSMQLKKVSPAIAAPAVAAGTPWLERARAGADLKTGDDRPALCYHFIKTPKIESKNSVQRAIPI